MKDKLNHILAVGPAVLICGGISFYIKFFRFGYNLFSGRYYSDHRFFQDDAYITYRYVANFLNGHGLVFNIGEYIEGITNFGWAMFLSMWGALGGDGLFIAMSEIFGWLLGAGTIVLTYFIAREVFTDKHRWIAAIPAYIVAANFSLSYWSISGLESGAFAFMAVLSYYLFIRRSWLLIASLTLAVLLRPEGALIAGLLIVVEAITDRRLPRFAFLAGVSAFVMCLPYVVFKIFYYGGILPNPFYAKTGFDLNQLVSGAEYVWLFFRHYGFILAGVVLPLIWFRSSSRSIRTVWLLFVLYTAYILFVGGDVLKVHRFFLPLFGLSAILVIYPVWRLVRTLKPAQAYVVAGLVGAGLIVLTLIMPWAHIRTFHTNEKGFIHKMQTQAQLMRQSYPDENFSVAVPTIGVFGYELLGHDIIDMVGLTDSTIARHSEEAVPGMESTWKERKHNSRYILSRQPTFICFSTGPKPSAPAEMALLLYPQFTDSYRLVGWYYYDSVYSPRGVTISAYRRMRPLEGEIVPVYSVEWVQTFKDGLNFYGRRQFPQAIATLSRCVRMEPQANNSTIMLHIGSSYMQMNRGREGADVLNHVLSRDSLVFGAHRDLYLYEMSVGNKAKAAIHREYLRKLTPWYLKRLERLVQRYVPADDAQDEDGG